MTFGQKNKLVCALPPVADAFAGTANSDVVLLEKYNHVTFQILTGASTTANGVVTVQACDDTTPSTTSNIAFNYISFTGGADDDTQSDLTEADSTGFAMTASAAEGMYLIEVDAAAIEGDVAGYKGVRVTVTEDTDDPQLAGIWAILSEPRYAQDALGTVLS